MQVSKSCKVRTRSGGRCLARAGKDGYCFFHSPQRARARAQAHRRGGMAKLIRKVSGEAVHIEGAGDILPLINKVLLDTWELENSAARSRALLAAAETAIKAMQIGELEQRVSALEAAIKDREP